MIVSQAEAERILQPYLPRFRRALQEAEAEFIAEYGPGRAKLSARSIASLRHDMMVLSHRRVFQDDPDVYFESRRGLFTIHIGDHSMARLKKLDRSLRTRSILTQQARLFNDQQLPMPGMPPEATRYVVGYQLDRLGLDVEHLWLTLPDGRGIAFSIPLDRADDGDTFGAQPTPIEPTPAPIKPRVRRRNPAGGNIDASENERPTTG